MAPRPSNYDRLVSAESNQAGDLEAHRRRLDEVEEALAHLESGDYGRCVSCGRDIPEERLSSDPLVRLCLSCAFARREENRGGA